MPFVRLLDQMPFEYVLVEFDPEAWSGGRDDVTPLKNQWLLEDRLVKRTLVCLLDEEVRRAGIDLDRSRSGYRTAVHVGSDHRVMSLRDARDPLRLGYPAAL